MQMEVGARRNASDFVKIGTRRRNATACGAINTAKWRFGVAVFALLVSCARCSGGLWIGVTSAAIEITIIGLALGFILIEVRAISHRFRAFNACLTVDMASQSEIGSSRALLGRLEIVTFGFDAEAFLLSLCNETKWRGGLTICVDRARL